MRCRYCRTAIVYFQRKRRWCSASHSSTVCHSSPALVHAPDLVPDVIRRWLAF